MTRLDVLLVEKGIASSRENAKRLIESGKVKVNSTIVTKSSKMFDDSVMIEAVQDKYVSRGAYKLQKALETFGISVEGKKFMDCGASTGGFTDCLLQNGAKKVWAVDVGTSQLAEKLKNDDRVVSIEQTNIRYMNKEEWMEDIYAAVMDLSFISLVLILERLFKILGENAIYIALIKPQFEAGKEYLNKNGIVKDKKIHVDVIEKICSFVEAKGHRIKGLTYSPISGGDGNIEYLICFGKFEDRFTMNRGMMEKLVNEAFDVIKKQ